MPLHRHARSVRLSPQPSFRLKLSAAHFYKQPHTLECTEQNQLGDLVPSLTSAAEVVVLDGFSEAKTTLSLKSLCVLLLNTPAEWGNPSAKVVFESSNFFLNLAFKGSNLDMVWEQGWSSDVLVFPEWKHEKGSSRQKSPDCLSCDVS